MPRTEDRPLTITYDSLAHYEISEEGAKPAAKPDVLRDFKPGWYWTGQITKHDAPSAKPLPYTVHVNDPADARSRAGKGWLPVELAPEKVKAMWRAYYGEDVPKALRAACAVAIAHAPSAAIPSGVKR